MSWYTLTCGNERVTFPALDSFAYINTALLTLLAFERHNYQIQVTNVCCQIQIFTDTGTAVRYWYCCQILALLSDTGTAVRFRYLQILVLLSDTGTAVRYWHCCQILALLSDSDIYTYQQCTAPLQHPNRLPALEMLEYSREGIE